MSYFVFRHHYWGDKVRYSEISETCSEHWGIRNAKENFISKGKRRNHLGAPGLYGIQRIRKNFDKGWCSVVSLVRNVMAHAQKPDFVFPLNGRVHSNRWGRQFSRLLAAEVCASALVILDIPRSEVAWEYWLPTPFTSFPLTSPPVRHRVPSGSERALLASSGSGQCPAMVPSHHINEHSIPKGGVYSYNTCI